jgi:hypothetical protein
LWLIVALVCALIVTVLHYSIKDKTYRFDFLSLMLWGAFVMVFVDHSIAYLNGGGDFISMTADGLVPDAVILGALMVVPLLGAWIVFAISTKIGAKAVSCL